ncbi:MAG: phospholipase A [Pseudomonadota bacterium]|jgi:phospholipase A1
MFIRHRWLLCLLPITVLSVSLPGAQTLAQPTNRAEIEARIQALNSELEVLQQELETWPDTSAPNVEDNDFEDNIFAGSAILQPRLLPQAIAIEDLNERRDLEQASNRNPFAITTHRTNYLLPVSYNSEPNRESFAQIDPDDAPNNTELKFQLSVKVGLATGLFANYGDLYFGYSQRSWWQAYNTEASSPFRETNYEPELFVDFDNAWEVFGWVNTRNRISANHESNGRSGELSRSWNRLYAESTFQRGDWAFVVAPHWRVPEAGSEDDNPDIQRYMGYGDLRLAKRLNNDQEVIAQWRGNPGAGNHGTQIDYSWPVFNSLRAHVQYYYGYGESLIDYDHRVHRLSLGFSLNPLFTPSGLNR